MAVKSILKAALGTILILALASSTGCRKVIRSDIGKLVPFKITSQPQGAAVKAVITIENYPDEGIQRELEVTTPYTEGPGTEGLVKFVEIDGEQNRQRWEITVCKKDFKKIERVFYSPEISETMHFILEPDIGE